MKVLTTILPKHLIQTGTFRPKAHKEDNDPGSHSLCIGSQADKEGKVEKAEAGGIGGLGEKKQLKILQLYVMSYDASWWKSHVITNGDVSFCCRPSVRSVPENNLRSFGSYQTLVQDGAGNVDCCRSRTPGPFTAGPQNQVTVCYYYFCHFP